MRLTKERKLFAGILGLALTALAVDRLILGAGSGPAAASADVVQPPSDQPPESGAPASPTVRAGRGLPVAKQFDVLRTHGSNALDGFAPPAGWATLLETRQLSEVPTPKAEPEKAPAEQVAQFWKKDKRLTGIVNFNDSTRAGVMLLVGSENSAGSQYVPMNATVGGLRLSAVSKTTATFEDPSGEIRVTLHVGGEPGAADDRRGP